VGGTQKERCVAMFDLPGGPEVGTMARRQMFEGHRDQATLEAWQRIAFPLYTAHHAIQTSFVGP